MSSGDAPMMRAHAMVNRVADLLEECHALKRDLEESDEPASVETECETLVSSIEAGLVRTMKDVLTILRHAGQPQDPMGDEWLDRQDRALNRDDDFTHATNSWGPRGVADMNPGQLEPLKPYAPSTVIPAICAGCGARSTKPGRDGWSWRWRPPRKGRGRGSQSWCPRCSGAGGRA